MEDCKYFGILFALVSSTFCNRMQAGRAKCTPEELQIHRKFSGYFWVTEGTFIAPGLGGSFLSTIWEFVIATEKVAIAITLNIILLLNDLFSEQVKN